MKNKIRIKNAQSEQGEGEEKNNDKVVPDILYIFLEKSTKLKCIAERKA
jgi:hypothetical protein